MRLRAWRDSLGTWPKKQSCFICAPAADATWPAKGLQEAGKWGGRRSKGKRAPFHSLRKCVYTMAGWLGLIAGGSGCAGLLTCLHTHARWGGFNLMRIQSLFTSASSADANFLLHQWPRRLAPINALLNWGRIKGFNPVAAKRPHGCFTNRPAERPYGQDYLPGCSYCLDAPPTPATIRLHAAWQMNFHRTHEQRDSWDCRKRCCNNLKKKPTTNWLKFAAFLIGTRRVAYRIFNLSCCPLFFFFFVSGAAERNHSVATRTEPFFTLTVRNVLSFFSELYSH